MLLAAVGLSIASTAGCAGVLLRDDVESARIEWKLNPDGQRAAVYAEALHDAFTGRAYVDQPAAFAQRAGEALAALAAGETGSGSRRPTLVAYRGLLLLDLGRNHEGWAELQRSMAIAPTLAAARGIFSVWGARGRNDEVAEACARTLPAMHDADGRFQLLDLCVKNMHTPTEAAALAWAPPGALAFYRHERALREQAAARARQQASDIAQAQQSMDIQAQQSMDMAN